MTRSNNGRKAKNLQYIRNANRASVFRYLALNGYATRMELTKYLGLSKMAISNIVSELLAEKLIAEVEKPEPEKYDQQSLTRSAGRRSLHLQLRAENFAAIGIYLSRDKLQAVLADITGQIYNTWNQQLDLSAGKSETENRDLLDEAFSRIAKQIKKSLRKDFISIKVIGVGLCSIGPLDIHRGILLDPPNFFGLEMIDLKQLSCRHFDLPVWLENDMNAAALAEHLYGAARGQQHCLYLGLSNGIGAGIIAYGRIFQGSGGYGGEVGHMCIQMDGNECYCGRRGCLETFISIPVLMAAAGVDNLEAIIDAAADTSQEEIWFSDFIRALETGLINMVNIFDPDIILLGHEGAGLVANQIDKLENEVNAGIFQKRARTVRIKLARHMEKAPLYGSASLVFQAVFRGDLIPGKTGISVDN